MEEKESDTLPTGKGTRPLVYEESLNIFQDEIHILFPLASENKMEDDKFPLSPSLIQKYQEDVTDLAAQMEFKDLTLGCSSRKSSDFKFRPIERRMRKRRRIGPTTHYAP